MKTINITPAAIEYLRDQRSAYMVANSESDRAATGNATAICCYRGIDIYGKSVWLITDLDDYHAVSTRQPGYFFLAKIIRSDGSCRFGEPVEHTDSAACLDQCPCDAEDIPGLTEAWALDSYTQCGGARRFGFRVMV